MWPFKDKQRAEIQAAREREFVLIASNKEYSDSLLAANNALTDAIRNRGTTGGYDHSDELHNIYSEFGYPQELEFFNLWNMYRRFGTAKAVVNKPVELCWSTSPNIESESDDFNSAFEIMSERISLWNRLQGLDKRQRVGRYAGLFMRIRDGKAPSEPISTSMTGEAALFDIMPLYESQLYVNEVYNDKMAENYGQPKMYQFRSGVEGDRDNKSNANFDIHPDRIVIAAEGSDNNSIYGISSLEALWNSLLDLRKIIGSGGEGFYKNLSQTVIFEMTNEKIATANAALLEGISEQYDDINKNRFRRAMLSPGLKPHTLSADIQDPKEFFMAAINDIAAGAGIPAAILIGEQTGKLASEKDNQAYNVNMQSRRVNYLSEGIRKVIDWCMRYGILPAAKYDVVWDDLLAPSSSEKLTSSKTMAEANKLSFDSGGNQIFSEEEIREAAGYDPEEAPDDFDLGEEIEEGDIIDAE